MNTTLADTISTSKIAELTTTMQQTKLEEFTSTQKTTPKSTFFSTIFQPPSTSSFDTDSTSVQSPSYRTSDKISTQRMTTFDAITSSQMPSEDTTFIENDRTTVENSADLSTSTIMVSSLKTGQNVNTSMGSNIFKSTSTSQNVANCVNEICTASAASGTSDLSTQKTISSNNSQFTTEVSPTNRFVSETGTTFGQDSQGGSTIESEFENTDSMNENGESTTTIGFPISGNSKKTSLVIQTTGISSSLSQEKSTAITQINENNLSIESTVLGNNNRFDTTQVGSFIGTGNLTSIPSGQTLFPIDTSTIEIFTSTNPNQITATSKSNVEVISTTMDSAGQNRSSTENVDLSMSEIDTTKDPSLRFMTTTMNPSLGEQESSRNFGLISTTTENENNEEDNGGDNDPNGLVKITYNCTPNCIYISSRNAVKISIGYHLLVYANCTTCINNNQQFLQLQFRRMFANSSSGPWVNISQSSSDGKIWNVTVNSYLKSANLTRQDVLAFDFRAFILYGDGEIAKKNFSLENNQAPTPGACALTPTVINALSYTYSQCSNWVDEDTIASYSYYKTYVGASQNLISSTKSANFNFTLSFGIYDIYVTATDPYGAESNAIYTNTVTVNAISVAECQQNINNLDSNASLSEMNALIDCSNNETLYSNSSSSSGNTLVANLLTTIYPIGNKTQDQILDVIRSTLKNELNTSTENLSVQQLKDLINEQMENQNDAGAQQLEKILDSLSQVPMTDGDTVIGVLSALNNAMENSISFTMDSTSIWVVVYGRIDTPDYTLIVVDATFQIDGATTYIEGDFRPAKFMQSSGDSFQFIPTYNMASAYVFFEDESNIFVDKGYYNSTNMSSGTMMTKLNGNASIAESNGVSMNFLNVMAWNITYDVNGAGEIQYIPNATFTSFVRVATDISVINVKNINNNTLTLFYAGTPIELTSAQIYIDFNSQEKLIQLSNGLMYFMSAKNGTFSIEIQNATWVNENDYDGQYFAIFQDSFKIQELDANLLDTLNSSATTQIVLKAIDEFSPVLITGFTTSIQPNITNNMHFVEQGTLTIPGNFSSNSDFQNQLTKGTKFNVPTGSIIFSDGNTIEFTDGFIQYNSPDLSFVMDSNANVEKIQNILYASSLTDGQIEFQITSGMYDANTQVHWQSILDVSATQSIHLSGGYIFRNGTNGYVITDAVVTTTGGLDLTKPGLAEQSLLNINAQQSIKNIMDNTTEFLQSTSASSLTDDQMDSIADNVLGIADKLGKNLEAAFENPLQSTMASALAYEVANYNNLFTYLPNDPSDIRYVEEYTEQEWAQEAAFLAQKAMAKQLISSMNQMVDSLEQVLIQRLLASGQNSGTMAYTNGGTSMFIAVGTPAEVFANPLLCNNWTVTFPLEMPDLNINYRDFLRTPYISNNTTISTSLTCMESNVYMYTQSATILVTDGTVDVKVKELDGTLINITNAIVPINITGVPDGNPVNNQELSPSYLQNYQILDLHSFITPQWNHSLIVQFTPMDGCNFESDIWLFGAFQRLPGPLPQDHDWRFKIEDRTFTTYTFISNEILQNKTGLFYIGIGITDTYDPDSNVTWVVDYTNFTSGLQNWTFTREIPQSMIYILKATRKGGFFYAPDPDDMYNSKGITTMEIVGDTLVEFNTNHLSTFSVGLFTPEISPTFDYTYLQANYPRNAEQFLIVMLFSLVAIILYIIAGHLECKDVSQGKLVYMADNKDCNKYQYIVTVETGFRMFSQTNSRVFFTISGENGEEQNRRLISNNKDFYLFEWGQIDRFVMRTKGDLGSLKYLRIWIDSSGMEHRQSWFCSRVIFKNMQTNENFYFDVNNWLGLQNGDGKTERLVEVTETKKRRYLDEAMSMHSFSDHLHWFSLFTGGGALTRRRYGRLWRVLNVYIMIMLSMTATTVYSKWLLNVDEQRSYDFSFLWFDFFYEDIYLGALFSLFTLPTSILIPYLFRQTTKFNEMKYLKWLSEIHPHLKNVDAGWQPWYTFCWLLSLQSGVLALFLFNLIVGFTMMESDVMSFVRKFYVGTLFWFFVVEPIKALFISYLYTRLDQDARIVNKYEKHILLIEKQTDIAENAYKNANKTVGKSISDLQQLQETRDARMRDEQLFETVREIIVFIVQLFILMGMAYFSKDTSAYYYNQDLRALFDLDNSYTQISTPFQFWNWTQQILVPNTTPAYAASWAYPVDVNGARYEYTFRTSENLSGHSYQGKYDTYSGGGYTVLLNGSQPDLAQQLLQLQQENWIDGNTRAIFVQFATYNAHINYFGVVDLVLEIPPIGAVFSDTWIEVIKLFRYIGSNTGAVIFFEVLYMALIVVLIFKTIYCLCKRGLDYVYSFWNTMEIFTVFFMIASIVVYILRFVESLKVANWFAATNGNVYINLEYARNLELLFLDFLATVVLLTVMKMIRILRFNRRIDVFAKTLSRSASTIGGFSICLMVILMAFNFACFILLYNQVDRYNNFVSLNLENIAAILGKASIETIISVNILSAITFILFNITGTIILVNVFIMIVMYEFERVRNDKKNQSNDYEAIQHVKNKAMIACNAYKRHHMTSMGLPNDLEVSTTAQRMMIKFNELLVKVNNLNKVPQKLNAIKPSNEFIK